MSIAYPVPQLAPRPTARPQMQASSFFPPAPPPAEAPLPSLILAPLAPPQGPRP